VNAYSRDQPLPSVDSRIPTMSDLYSSNFTVSCCLFHLLFARVVKVKILRWLNCKFRLGFLLLLQTSHAHECPGNE